MWRVCLLPQELTHDRILAEGNLRQRVSRLRHLRVMQRAHTRSLRAATGAAAGATEAGTAATAAGTAAAEGPGDPHVRPRLPAAAPNQFSTGAGGVGGEEEDELCPICRDKEVVLQCAMLPCSHCLCFDCTELLVARAPHGLPHAQRSIRCPTCRRPAAVADITYLDDGV